MEPINDCARLHRRRTNWCQILKYFKKILNRSIYFFKKWDIRGFFFFIFVFSTVYSKHMFCINFCQWLGTNCGTLDRKWPLYQLSHNHCPHHNFLNGQFPDSFLFFFVFSTANSEHNFCQWLGTNCRPLVLGATPLPTEPQPLTGISIFSTRIIILAWLLRTYKSWLLWGNSILQF